MGGAGPIGPLFSILLVPAVATGRNPVERLTAALGYYATGCWPIVGAVAGYWGTGHAVVGLMAWAACNVGLAIPWALAANWRGLLFALATTALPPLGVIGWLSPLNAAGVLFPGMGWIGLALAVGSMLAMHSALSVPAGQGRPRLFVGASWWTLLSAAIVAIGANVLAAPASAPHGWVGVQTHILPSKGNVLRAIQNNQSIIDAGLAQGKGARVVIFPEAVLENWLPGTRQQFAEAVPPGQIWLIGAQAGRSDAVVAVTHARATAMPLAKAAGLLLGGDWQPWKKDTLRPTWVQHAFALGGTRVWAALCVEQVQPWTWLGAAGETRDHRGDVQRLVSAAWHCSARDSEGQRERLGETHGNADSMGDEPLICRRAATAKRVLPTIVPSRDTGSPPAAPRTACILARTRRLPYASAID
ncbi:putative Permease of the major facilitator superfamily, traB-like [Thiomonas arsenitoxydans]|uniref:Permease of the major facilitator superfamily, traB-like n=1 Tax=Thiomonas arsenitoxydans (strain DSM 22701 / CIP 110005 / 3As) TaxID=426114 RepID=D6CTQ4_THIA3|nr:MFS transporter [Thiomonas arsenitoxydans]CQR44514.1 putative Permease of the major facilitator superfamily, traB-like [Thiomonas sp. CB3]CAZ88673.1 Putative Permease of the major facilitator superfamily, traB-like [Thiomonas arsenitoxydans]CQR27821.1 putative Permease of the major facilitator superfamily, traB-like [Thiomonas arsenitoxydans]CQR31896.1 putative Permease of the major facilitator superfamily, traB-like [Thiomonas arsenitoxydans]CQR34863.1 putative Permease of the major facili